ncbi:MAG TPA: hypothetical protein VGX68_14300 [Thermoanaerobaculia bacterium]|nr:hypothetical protein [Thermoanaerobaculia bacterium]
MGELIDLTHCAAGEIAAEGYDIAVLGGYLPGPLRRNTPHVFVVFATPEAVAFAGGLGVESPGNPPGAIIRRVLVGILLEKAQQAGLKVKVAWRPATKQAAKPN